MSSEKEIEDALYTAICVFEDAWILSEARKKGAHLMSEDEARAVVKDLIDERTRQIELWLKEQQNV